MKLHPIAALFCLAATAAVATPAPSQAQRLATTTVSPAAKTGAKKAEPLTGFLGIKWGDSPEQAKKILAAKHAEITEADDATIHTKTLLRVTNVKVADYETDDIMLRFGSDGFYQANVVFHPPMTTDAPKILNDLRLIISERFGDNTANQPVVSGGFGNATPNYLEWNFDRSEKASLKLLYTSSGKPMLEYRANDRAEREEARIRSEKAKSL